MLEISYHIIVYKSVTAKDPNSIEYEVNSDRIGVKLPFLIEFALCGSVQFFPDPREVNPNVQMNRLNKRLTVSAHVKDLQERRNF